MQHNKITDVSILIAEDEEALLDSMTEYLELFFEKVYRAKDGQEAYQSYLKHHHDIIIADINMPRLDGLAMIRKIRENDQKTKIIITSAHSDQERLLQAIELHLVKYLIKPVQSDWLKTLLLSLVDELRSQRHTLALKEAFYWDTLNQKLFHNAEEIALKPRERKVMSLLCSHPNQSVSAIDIYNHLYEDQPERDFSSHAIASLMKRLRQKLPKDTIKSAYGVGYILQTK
ncbi:response regulator transcription factor [Sulfurovum sp. NBC37-1]|uniref:response regulator transcription factor n=1 Tax=Sulfurovum sp. (strain NBC37-1) TaxID=387093 RepID=UPI0001587AE7|nr:response regulator transcription factor [Sulfurovum sp. NBC37-1]BAF72772.1 two-component response regulator [Sulfurovum sp. NBC37-1]